MRSVTSPFAVVASFAFAATVFARAQEEAPTVTAAPPPSFEIDRANGPLAFDLEFKLADHDDAHLQMLLAQIGPDDPKTSDSKSSDSRSSEDEREIFGLDFQPFEGARFVLSRSSRSVALVSSALMQVPEPTGLDFHLHVELPQEGGLAVTTADGIPIVIATTPRARRMKIEFAASGGVLSFTATKSERVSKLSLDPAAEKAFAELLATPHEPSRSGAFHPLGPEIVKDLSPVPAIKEVRVVDRQEIAGGIVERLVIVFEEGVEAPLVVARPAGDAKLPARLCIAGGAKGKAEGAILRSLANGIATGQVVASFEIVGSGERQLVLPHDALRVPELELVGLSSFDLATIEALQTLQWLRSRPDVDATRVTVAGSGAGEFVARRIAQANPAAQLQALVGSGAELPADLTTIGDDYLHLRFDSLELERARARRDELPAPDDSLPLEQRMDERESGSATPSSLNVVVFAPNSPPVRWDTAQPAPKLRTHVTLVASDRGSRVAIEESWARFAQHDDETCVAVDPRDLAFVSPGGASLELQHALEALRTARGTGAEPLRVFADGAVALPLLATIVAAKAPISSFTAAHAIPSFDLLLARPHEAHRADPELGVFTQGLPEWAFVPNALTRWEIEDAVLALRERGVAVDWQDPVDALRRPLSRHDRLAMWPRVRHAQFVR